jgi:UDP-glucose 4-epimerase
MTWRPSWWLDVLKTIWPLSHLSARATQLPLVGPLVTALGRPFFGKQHFNISYLPVHAKIEPAVNEVLSQAVIAELIRRSAHRVVIKRCTCRDSKGCQTYPIEDACLLLGEDTRAISPDIARSLTVDEALAHLESRIGLGLIPMTGRVRVDDLFYGVPNRGRMLTVCFCCPCCCTVLASAKYFPPEFRSSIEKLKGVHIRVDDAVCTRCTTCMDECPLDAISLRGGGIVHDENLCIGCGRCSTVCPTGATRLIVEDSDSAVSDLLDRIRQRVDVG